MHRRALQQQKPAAFGRRIIAQRLDQPGLSYPGLTGQDCSASGSSGSLGKEPSENSQFIVTPDQRHAALTTERLKPAQAFPAPGLQPIDGFRLLEALELLGPEILEVECLANDLACCAADHSRVFDCDGLQARRLVQAGTNNVLAVVVAVLLVDHHPASGDTD